MGVNLVARIPLASIQVKNRILTKENHEHDFEDNCLIDEGKYRLLIFDFFCHNVGDIDFEIGSPKSRPDIFVRPSAHPHWHLKGFNKYTLLDITSKEVVRSLKQSFCVTDMLPLSFPENEWENITPRFVNCENEDDIQGISSGWADVYRSSQPCQYIVLDDPSGKIHTPNGEYILVAETNAIQDEGVFKGKRLFDIEDNYEDNVIRIKLKILDNNVKILPPSTIFFDKPSY